MTVSDSEKLAQMTGGKLPQQKKKKGVPWKLLRQISRVALYVGLVLYVYGTYVSKKFDDTLAVDKLVRRNPLQVEAPGPQFEFSYHGNDYIIQPVAEYEIAGLVVTHNNISSITDAYHTSKSVDFRDICMVWGVNVTNNVFRRAQFASSPWTCHVQFNDRLAEESFVMEQLSNTHLLSKDESVRQKVLSMRVGDQVQLKGKLINYWPRGASELSRNSSLIRTDTGDGACEVMWVEEARILQRAQSNWDSLRSLGIWLLIGAVILGALVFFLAPYGST
ncbi:MAG: hypothetical protein KDD55_03230 [Bdellovibrionales bacterium]|nr:hypothetical protein [Bdellovibrionales bacterium]